MKVFSMFSGVGGFEIGYHKLGWETVGLCEIDNFANQVLKYNFKGVKNYGNARDIVPGDLPDFDMLVGGFPCQAFSIAGKRKGFGDTRGTLFNEIIRIAAVKRPSFLLLENVAGLCSHDKGRTLKTILEAISELGYILEWKVYNGKYFGVPQNRERIFIVGVIAERYTGKILFIEENDRLPGAPGAPGPGRTQAELNFTSLKSSGAVKADDSFIVCNRGEFIEKDVAMCLGANEFKGPDTHGARNMIITRSPKYIDNKRTVEINETDICQALKADTKKGNSEPLVIASRGRGKDNVQQLEARKDGNTNSLTSVQKDNLIQIGNVDSAGNNSLWGRVYSTEGIAPNLNANGGGCGAKTGLYQQEQRIRRLTPIECERLMSWPDNWTAKGMNVKGEEYNVSDSQRYKMCGNGVISNCVEYICRLIQKEYGDK